MLLIESPNIFRGAGNDYNIRTMYCKRVVKPSDRLLVEKISNIIKEETGIHPNESTIYRGREYVQSRQLLAVMLLNYTTWSQAKIGMVAGNKDHATIINCRKAIANRYDTDRMFRDLYNRINGRVKLFA